MGIAQRRYGAKTSQSPMILRKPAFGPEVDAYIEKRGKKYHLDLKQINAMVLRRCGVEHIDLSRDCTVCSCDRFWSHRATGGERGSQGAVIVCQEVTG